MVVCTNFRMLASLAGSGGSTKKIWPSKAHLLRSIQRFGIGHHAGLERDASTLYASAPMSSSFAITSSPNTLFALYRHVWHYSAGLRRRWVLASGFLASSQILKLSTP